MIATKIVAPLKNYPSLLWYSMCISQIKGINGTMIANRNVHMNSTATVVRTVMTLDNGGEWSYISPPETDLSGIPILCEPPGCSLHFHMGTSAFARLGVYSQVCSYNNNYYDILYAHDS